MKVERFSFFMGFTSPSRHASNSVSLPPAVAAASAVRRVEELSHRKNRDGLHAIYNITARAK